MAYRIVADIGGTKVAAALTDKNMSFLTRKQVSSDPTDAEAMFNCLVNCFAELLDSHKVSYEEIESISLGVPGKVDSENGVAVYQNNLPWRDFPLSSRLRTIFFKSKGFDG